MRNNLYYHEVTDQNYREMTDQMYNRFLQHPDQIDAIEERQGSSIPDFCAKAVNAYGVVVTHCEDEQIDWDSASVEYADDVIDSAFDGGRLEELDMISMASQSGLNAR